MYASFSNMKIGYLQDDMYEQVLNRCSPAEGRLCSLPVSVADVVLETLKTPLQVIESVAYFAINLLGAAFFKRYSLRDAMLNVEDALSSALRIPVVLVLMIPKLIYQLCANLYDPERAVSVARVRTIAFQETLDAIAARAAVRKEPWATGSAAIRAAREAVCEERLGLQRGAARV